MKTEEFIEKIKNLGYTVRVGKGETRVSSKTGNIVALVSEVYQNSADITCMGSPSNDLFDTIVAYAKTPVEYRKEVIRKRVKIVSTDENSYLHVDVFSVGQPAYLGSLVCGGLTHAIDDFSPEQIEQLKSRDDIAVDWNKVCFEDAE